MMERKQKTKANSNSTLREKYRFPSTKFLLPVILVCLTVLSSYGQTKPSNAKASNSKTLTGAILPLVETQTFAVAYPKELQYWGKGEAKSNYGVSLSLYPQDMKAKMAKKGVLPDYTFTLITSGIDNVERGMPVHHPQGGLVIEIKYTFPCILQVTDKEGKVVRNFELSSDDNVMTATVHPQFLDNAASGTYTPIIPIVTGFKAGDPVKEVDDKIDIYLTRVEFNAYHQLVEQARRVITNAYGFPKTSYAPVVLEVNKKEKDQFEELNEQVEKLKAAVNEVFEGPLNDDVKSRLMELGEYFASNYTENTPKDSKRLYGYNAALAYLLGGDADEGYRHFKAAKLGQISSALIFFDNLFPIATEINRLYASKDNLDIVILPVFTVDDLLKQEKEVLELAKQQELQKQKDEWRQGVEAHNVNDVPGYVVTKSGEKIEGVINMKFVELANSQIVDMDIAKLVRVSPEGAKSQALKPKNVSYIVAGDKRFEPVTVATSAVGKVLGAVGGNFGDDYFMEVVHKNGGCTAFYDPTIISTEVYYVRTHDEAKVESYNTIIRGGKASEKFFGNHCPDLLKRIKNKEFKTGKENLITFVNELAECVE